MDGISGTRSLHRLIYCSQARLLPEQLDAQVEAIVAQSIDNNAKVGVSGLLLCHGGYFLQALEGAAEAVMTTYGRILGDRRHDACQVLAAGPASERCFADWEMCARKLTAADDAILETLSQRDSFAPQLMSGGAALRLLMAVRGIKRRLEA